MHTMHKLCACTYTHVYTITYLHTQKKCSLPPSIANFCPPNHLGWSSYSASLLLTTESLTQENKWTMLHHALREHKAMDRRPLHR